jgi:hypothetical protein
MANPYEFLRDWVANNANPTAYDDRPSAKHLARECLAEAERRHISTAGVIKAAGGNLANFMETELNSAANREVDRLAEKDTT